MKKILNRIILILILLFLIAGIGYFGTGMFGKLGKFDIFKDKTVKTDEPAAANRYTQYSAGNMSDGLQSTSSEISTSGAPQWAVDLGFTYEGMVSNGSTIEFNIWNTSITVKLPSSYNHLTYSGARLEIFLYCFATRKYLPFDFVDVKSTKGEYIFQIPMVTEVSNSGAMINGVTLSLLTDISIFVRIYNGSPVSYYAFKDFATPLYSAEDYNQSKAEGYEQGKSDGIEQGKTEGYEQGKTDGTAEGYESGKVDGIEQGKAEGYEQGKSDGIEQGKNDGYTSGKIDGYNQGKTDGNAEGYEKGKLDGYAAGEADGIAKAKAEAFDVSDYGIFDFLKTAEGKNLIAFMSCAMGLVIVLAVLSIVNGVKARGC